MKRNNKLEKNQQTSYFQKGRSYRYTCSGAGVSTDHSSKIQALLPGTRLHFLRYGYFDKHSEVDVGFHIDGPETGNNYSVNELDVSNGDMQSTDNFYVARTTLNEGFIYLLNESDTDDFHELAVNCCGGMSRVFWGNVGTLKRDGDYSDTRKSIVENIDYMLVDPKKKMWIAYSPVQWSIDFCNEIISNSDKRSEHMMLVDCAGIKKGEETASEHVLPFSEIKFVHYKSHPNHNRLEKEVKLINYGENTEDAKDDNKIYEDMFITFHDPIGAANDIADLLSIEVLRQKAILEAIQSGRKEDEVLNRMLRGEVGKTVTSEEEQIGAMANLALTQYKLIYDDNQMINDYDGGDIGHGGGVYKPKLLKILGVEKRKKLREKIRKFQNDLGGVLEKDYFKNAYYVHEHGSKFNLIDGKKSAIRFYKLLAIKPHLQDKAFDLLKDEEIDNKWDDLIIESLQEEESIYPVYNVLNKIVDLDEDNINDGKKVSLSEKLAMFIQESLETYAQFAMEDLVSTSDVPNDGIDDGISSEEATKEGIDLTNKSAAFAKSGLEQVSKVKKTVTKVEYHTSTKTVVKPCKFTLTVNRLNKLKVYGEEMFEVRAFEVQEQLQAEKCTLDNGKIVKGKYRGKQDIYRWVKTESSEIVLKETSHGKHVFDIPVNREVKEVIQTAEVVSHKEPTKMAAKAEAVLDGAPFKGVVALLQVFNLGAAIHTFSKDPNPKNTFNLVGISAEFASATGFFLEKTLTKVLSKEILGRIGVLAGRADVVGAGVTVIMCTWDAYKSFDARDKDAGWAWTGAAVVFAGVTAAGIINLSVAATAATAATAAEAAAILAAFSWTGPVALLCAGIGVGLVFLAYYLKDTPLEIFFKNNALSDEVDFTQYNGNDVGEYNKIFYSDRKKLCPDTDYQKWNDFKYAGAVLTDLIISSRVDFKPLYPLKDEEDDQRSILWALITGKKVSNMSGYIKKLEINVYYGQFLKSEDQFVYQLYFFKYGFNGKHHEMKDVEPEIRIEKGDDEKPTKIVLTLDIPENYLKHFTENTKILLVSALVLSTNNFYPTLYNENFRLMGAYFGVKYLEEWTGTKYVSTTKSTFEKSNIAIAPLNELLAGKGWDNLPDDEQSIPYDDSLIYNKFQSKYSI